MEILVNIMLSGLVLFGAAAIVGSFCSSFFNRDDFAIAAGVAAVIGFAVFVAGAFTAALVWIWMVR